MNRGTIVFLGCMIISSIIIVIAVLGFGVDAISALIGGLGLGILSAEIGERFQ